MAVYSITDIEQLTGIKAHTLRTWEKRYGLQISRRSPANVRFYLDEDLRRIINISILNKAGMKISQIARLNWAEIRHKVAETADVHNSHETDLDSLSLCLINLDQNCFDRIISINTEQNGFNWVLDHLIFPLFEKINAMYLTGTIKPVHESFFNYLLKGKIMSQIDKLRSKQSHFEPEYLIFQPSGSAEELGSMLLNYHLIDSGKSTLNLGVNIDTSDIIEAYQLHKVTSIIGLFNADVSKEEIERYIDQVHDHAPEAQLILSGFDVFRAGITSEGHVIVLSDLNAIMSFIKEEHAVSNGVEV